MRNACLYLVFILAYKLSFATTSGAFFNVTSQTTPTGATLNIMTTIPNYSYPMASIRLNNSEYSFTNPSTECTKMSHGNCLVSVNNQSGKEISITGAVGNINMTLCLNGNGPLSCQNYQVPISYAYVANDSGQILLCSIHSNGDFGTCFDGGGSGFNGPDVVTFNDSNTMAYVTNSLLGIGSVFLCSVQSDYKLDSCNIIASDPPFQVPFGLVLNRAQTNAYIPNGSGGNVLKCLLNHNGTFGACEDSGNTGVAFGYPLGIAFNHAQTTAYVTNNGNHTVSVCPIQDDGRFGHCIDSNNVGIDFVSPQGIVLNKSETKAYVTNTGNNTVSICPIKNDGTFGLCEDSGNTFSYPIWIVLNTDETIAYVTNNTSNTVSICPVKIDGTLGTCHNTGAQFSGPEGITLMN